MTILHLIVTFSLLAVALAYDYYIIPFINASCPHTNFQKSCVTLSEYSESNHDQNNISTSLVFHSGNHSLHSQLDFSNVASLEIYSNSETGVTIIFCDHSAGLIFENISQVEIRNISFFGCEKFRVKNASLFLLNNSNFTGHNKRNDSITVLTLQFITRAKINRISVFSFTNIKYGGAIKIVDCSTIWFHASNFESNKGIGGALTVIRSSVYLTNSTFINNTAATGGSAVYTHSSDIRIQYCLFERNCYTTDKSSNFESNKGFGGALAMIRSSVYLTNSTFINNIAASGGSAVYTHISDIRIQYCLFERNCNTTDKSLACSGAIYSVSGSILITNTRFVRNNMQTKEAHGDECRTDQCGGALFARSSLITVNKCNFSNNRATFRGGAIYCLDCTEVVISNSVFLKNKANHGGAVSLRNRASLDKANVTYRSSVVFKNIFSENKAIYGGAIHCYDCVGIKIEESEYVGNYATQKYGGALFLKNVVNLYIVSSTFSRNSARYSGGAIHAQSMNQFTVTITDSTFFECKANSRNGGAMYVSITSASYTETSDYVQLLIVNCSFIENKSYRLGGALYAKTSNITMVDTVFQQNTALQSGGALCITSSYLSSKDSIHFVHNTGNPGVVYAINGNVKFTGYTRMFGNNGSIFAFSSNLTLSGEIWFERNSGYGDVVIPNFLNLTRSSIYDHEGGAITCIHSNIYFVGNATFMYNRALFGGAVKATELSRIYFYQKVLFSKNFALHSGGSIFVYQSELYFRKQCTISSNLALSQGGGIDAIASTLKLLQGSVVITNNSAVIGGGLSLSQNSKVYVIKTIPECEESVREVYPNRLLKRKFMLSNNRANYGGGIYVKSNTHACGSSNGTALQLLGECFLQVVALYLPQGYTTNAKQYKHLHFRNVYFKSNTAIEAGSDIFGGFYDRCTVNPSAEVLLRNKTIHSFMYLRTITNVNVRSVASEPLQVWFCTNNKHNSEYNPGIVSVQKGDLVSVNVVAVDQVNNTVFATIHISVASRFSRINEGQSMQNVTNKCSTLQFNLFSYKESEVITLYAVGPCNGIGVLSTKNFTVKFKACTCPIGFEPLSSSSNECTCRCNSSLSIYITNCFIENSTLLRHGEFWISYNNYSGFVIYPQCPYDYCYPSTSNRFINFQNPNGSDEQCYFNRGGVLCGSCKEGLSLALGSSRCLPCSNKWLVLIIPFAVAGIALVTFLLVCNLTVAVGTLNSLIFYANIVIANKSIFFPFKKPSILVIFISWLNLDLGIETCFFNGMDAYVRTWLQFVFPLYLIMLLILIIVVSEASSQFARLLSSKNPVATLVTVILFSYTKLLRAIIDSFSFAYIPYPENSKVWLIDGNVLYATGKHIPLIFASLLITIIGVAFTLLLFSWQWLLQYSNKYRALKWIGKHPKIQSIMDAYHAPFKPKYRYWSGLLLFTRVFLYLVSSGNIHGDPRSNLVAVNVTITCLFVLKLWLGNKMYTNWFLNILEDVFFIKVIIFSVVTRYIKNTNGNQIPVAYASLGIAFVIFCGILIYHMFAFVLKNSRYVKRVFYDLQKLHSRIVVPKRDHDTYDTSLNLLLGDPSASDYKLAELPTGKHHTKQPVTTTVVRVD